MFDTQKIGDFKSEATGKVYSIKKITRIISKTKLEGNTFTANGPHEYLTECNKDVNLISGDSDPLKFQLVIEEDILTPL